MASLGPPRAGSAGGLLRRLIPERLWPRPTMLLDDSYIRAMQDLPRDARILNLGSGEGVFDRWEGRKPVALDIDPAHGVDVCADAHRLPFRDGAFDAVYSNAVLEHVRKPWVVAQEIRRVTRIGGLASISIPFLNIIHGVTDYYRFTADGLRVLFEDFEELKCGVAAGPSSFFTVFIPEYVSGFFVWPWLRSLVKLLVAGSIWPMKYLDGLIRRSDRLHVAADAFYFVGRRIR